MKIVCLDAATLGNYDLSIFKEFGEFEAYQTTKKDEVISRLQGAQVAIVNKILMTREVIQACPDLKLILETATGVNNIDLEAAKQHNIIVKNAAGYSTMSVLEHTFALIFAFYNQIIFYDKWTKDGLWTQSEIFTDYSRILHTLNGKNYGIIGLGTIGKKVADAAELFGANVFYHSTSGMNLNAKYEHLSLNDLLAKCDVISIHAPLNEKTKNLLNASNLNLLKDGAILINVGRGGIINEADLAKIIDERDIRVGLDVLENEPMLKNHPLLNIKNKERLIITPHVAWASAESIENLMKIVYENLKIWIENGK